MAYTTLTGRPYTTLEYYIHRYIPRSLPDNVEGDSRFLANYTALKMLTGLRDEEIVFASYHNKVLN